MGVLQHGTRDVLFASAILLSELAHVLIWKITGTNLDFGLLVQVAKRQEGRKELYI